MGKDKSKGKERKVERKLEIERERALKQLVKDATAANPLETVPAFARFQKNGLDVTLSSPSDVSVELYAACMTMLKTNMTSTYEASGWQGVPSWAKQEESLKEDEAQLLVLRETGSEEFVGFAHFYCMVEGDVPVLYLYELQLAEAFRGKGLGRHSMALLQIYAIKMKMQFVMTTVFKESGRAAAFFLDKMKFAVDETSPSRCDIEDDSAYEILSKCVDPELIKAKKADEAGKGKAPASPPAKAEKSAEQKSPTSVVALAA